MFRYRVNQHFIVLNLINLTSIPEGLYLEFYYVFPKVIECLEQNIRKKSVAKDHQVQVKWTEYKIFELKSELANVNITS